MSLEGDFDTLFGVTVPQIVTDDHLTFEEREILNRIVREHDVPFRPEDLINPDEDTQPILDRKKKTGPLNPTCVPATPLEGEKTNISAFVNPLWTNIHIGDLSGTDEIGEWNPSLREEIESAPKHYEPLESTQLFKTIEEA